MRPNIRADARNSVRWLARRRATRRVLNLIYSSLGYPAKERFHNAFAYLFRDCDQAVQPGTWTTSFAGKAVRLPFGGGDTWIEWDAATAVLGHDPEVKRSYETLIRTRRPRVFFDIGTNVGLHSLLFLVHGVRTVSFEPNPACHGFLRRIAALNGVECDIRQLALGAADGEVELSFPERETWLGTTVAQAKDELASRGALTHIRVPQTTLDGFCREHGLVPDLIKIDTEGNELAVLEGGLATLGSARPIVIFESWRDETRHALYRLLQNVGYDVVDLPLEAGRPATPKDIESFASTAATNFAALPHDRDR